ncbi:MAG: hypothetical protein CMJ84_02270 [Planctomycetes bacterium]|nr:hypothetical protein [Planctomycetota bacterium]
MTVVTLRKTSFAAAFLGAVGLLFFFALREGAPPEVLERGALGKAVEATQGAPPPAFDSRLSEGADSDSALGRAERAPVDSGARAEPITARAPKARVLGRFLSAGGAPAEGALVRLDGWVANSERELEFGVPGDWADPEVRTDAAGRFEIELTPPRAFQFVLTASVQGHAELSWRWSALAPGSVTDLGEQTFLAAGTIVGRVVDADGEPVGVAWTVQASGIQSARGEGGRTSSAHALADERDGTFRLEGLPPGTARLSARSKMAARVTGPSVEVVPGAVTTADIVYRGPPLDSRIVVRVFCRPFFVFTNQGEGAIRCTDAAGVERVAEKVEGTSQSWAFVGLAPGSYTIRIESELHAPWSEAGVRPGESVKAQLVGNAAVVLTVIDGATGENVGDYGLLLRFEEARFSPNTFSLHEAGDEPPAGGVYGGLIPRASTLIVSAAGFAPCEIELGELAPHEVRVVSAELDRGGRLGGVVRRESGEGAAGVALLLHPHHDGYDPSDPFSGPLDSSTRSAFRARSRSSATDARGHFAFETLAPGDYDLRVSDGAVTRVHEHLLVERGSDEALVIELPAAGSLLGTLVGPSGAVFEGLAVLVYAAGSVVRQGWYHEDAAVTQVRVDASGRFRAKRPAGGEEHRRPVPALAPNPGGLRLVLVDPTDGRSARHGRDRGRGRGPRGIRPRRRVSRFHRPRGHPQLRSCGGLDRACQGHARRRREPGIGWAARCAGSPAPSAPLARRMGAHPRTGRRTVEAAAPRALRPRQWRTRGGLRPSGHRRRPRARPGCRHRRTPRGSSGAFPFRGPRHHG